MQYCNKLAQDDVCINLFLSVSFGSIMCLAKHLAILYVCSTALTPSRYVVGIHIFDIPNLGVIGIVTDGT